MACPGWTRRAFHAATRTKTGGRSCRGAGMSGKLSVSELLRLACLYAEQDRRSWLDAMRNCTGVEDADVIQKAETFLAQLQEYRVRRWGKTKLEQAWETAVPMSPAEVIRNSLERGKTK